MNRIFAVLIVCLATVGQTAYGAQQKVNGAQTRVRDAFVYARIKFDDKLSDIFPKKELMGVTFVIDKIQSLLPELLSSESCNVTVEQFLKEISSLLNDCKIHGNHYSVDKSTQDLFIEYANIYFTLYAKAKELIECYKNQGIMSDRDQYELQDNVYKILISLGNETAVELQVT